LLPACAQTDATNCIDCVITGQGYDKAQCAKCSDYYKDDGSNAVSEPGVASRQKQACLCL
jgi:hypothetical protein